MNDSSGGYGNDQTPKGTLKLTFHDNPMVGTDVKQVNLNVLRTEIVDFYDNRLVVSSSAMAFDLLQLTKNNPVVLAHAEVPAGTYKQIRLILDNNSTLTMNDGAVAPLKVPSGEQTGIKIDGIFTVPEGQLYTLDIDLDPSKSIHYTKGEGWLLKPVITLTGLDVIHGNFYYAVQNEFNGANNFILNLNSNGTVRARFALHPKLIASGRYIFDGIDKTFEATFDNLICNDCNIIETIQFEKISPYPEIFNQYYGLLDWGDDFIVLSRKTETLRLNKVANFELSSSGYKSVNIDVSNINVTGVSPANKILVGELVPLTGGKTCLAAAYIGSHEGATLNFSIPYDDLKTDPKDYALFVYVVNHKSDIKLTNYGQIDYLNNQFSHGTRVAIFSIDKNATVGTYGTDY